MGDNRSNTQRTEVAVEDFVPYACHYDDHTILTKNGELMQTIKLTGFTFESVHKDARERLSLRAALRKAIVESIKTDNFALYFHTIRRKHDLSTAGVYPAGFTQELNNDWCKRHDWEHKYINELYVTIIIQGQSLKFRDVKGFFRAIYFPKELKQQMGYLEQTSLELNRVAGNILGHLEAYGVRRLGMVKHRDGVYYSELSGFLSKIINLSYEPIPVTAVDLSTLLPSHSVSFGFNALEVEGDTGRHFAAMITIKEYHEISSKAVDDLLQIPQEFIISETFDFVNSKKGLEAFKKQKRYMQISDDKFLANASGLNAILAADQGTEVDYGEHQITIMILEDSLPLLERGVGQAIQALHRMGVIGFREDVYMEDCYWAQLPANFVFNKRMTSINTGHIGGYASLYNFPAGKLGNNHWGPAVTVFYTAAQTPYFFNFHYGDNGHTFIVGPYGAGKTVLMNFLVSQSMKFRPKLFFFDQQRGAEIFIRAIGGDYHHLTTRKDKVTMRFNPLHLEDTPKNRQFLLEWLGYLIRDNPDDLEAEDRKKIQQAVEYVYSLEHHARNLTNLIPKFWVADVVENPAASAPVVMLPDAPPQEPAGSPDAMLSMEELAGQIKSGGVSMEEMILQQAAERAKAAAALAVDDDLTAEAEAAAHIPVSEKIAMWHGEGAYAHLFDNEEDELALEGTPLYGFDMTQIVEDNHPLIPAMFYLLHVIEQSLDGQPTIIVLDEAWALIDNAAFSRHLGEWMDRLRAKNAIIIFATESVEKAEESPITRALAEKIETKIFLPNPEASMHGYADVFGLSSNEFQMLKSMSKERHQFLLKHNIDAVVAELNLDGMEYELAVLSTTVDRLAIMNGAIRDVGKEIKAWLPAFKQRLMRKK